MKTEEIDAILANPEQFSDDPVQPSVLSSAHLVSRIDLFNHIAEQKRDLNEHAQLLRLAASKCQHVTEVSKHRESSIFLMAGNPERLISYQQESDPLLDLQLKLMPGEAGHPRPLVWTLTTGSVERPPLSMEPTELLFINVEPTYARVKAELDRNGNMASKYIMIANAGRYGEKGSDGTFGIRYAVTQFVTANPDWYYHTMVTQQNGMLVLSKVLSERQKYPAYPWDRACGPGTELKKLLGHIGFHELPGVCSCKTRRIKMDAVGRGWCSENVNEIVGWLHQEHIRRNGRFFWWFGAKMLVRLAIWRARRKDCK